MNNEQAYNLSSAFWLAHQRCLEARPVAEGIQILMAPGIVNAVFSIELGFKAIIRSEKGEETKLIGHKLINLFEDISVETQEILIAESGFSRDTFQSSLTTISNAFQDWRYVYEQTELNLDLAFVTAVGSATQVASARFRSR